MKTYYFPNPEHEDEFFGGFSPVCIDLPEVLRLADEWGVFDAEIMTHVHEATEDEIAKYGVYDS